MGPGIKEWKRNSSTITPSDPLGKFLFPVPITLGSAGPEVLAPEGGVLLADVCQENGLPFHNRWIKDSPFPVSDCRDFIRQALIDHPHTDGIFASSDLIAAQVIQVCSDLRIRIPEDIRLVGFNDISLASLTTPPITTIRQPLHEMA